MAGKLKAFSPIISVVILVGIVVALGIILSSWATQWVSNNIESASSSCVTTTSYRIDEITYDNSTQTLKVIVTNIGNKGVYGFGLQLYTNNEIESYNSTNSRISLSPNISSTNPLTESRSVIINLNMTRKSDIGMALTKVRVLNTACSAFYIESKNINKET